MSGGFHHIVGEGRSLWRHLQPDTIEHDRPITGEPVADAIGAVLRAIGPIEEAVAHHQDCDAGVDRVMIACVENGPAIDAACKRLTEAVQGYRYAIANIARQAAAKEQARA